MSGSLANLIGWYECQCNGIWEHSHGIKINSLDNPGFIVKVDLKDTALEVTHYKSVDWESASFTEHEWISCYKSDENVWVGACSPKQLEKTINLFIEWVEFEGSNSIKRG